MEEEQTMISETKKTESINDEERRRDGQRE